MYSTNKSLETIWLTDYYFSKQVKDKFKKHLSLKEDFYIEAARTSYYSMKDVESQLGSMGITIDTSKSNSIVFEHDRDLTNVEEVFYNSKSDYPILCLGMIILYAYTQGAMIKIYDKDDDTFIVDFNY